MSTIPGYTLEKLLMWNYNLIVEGDDTANVSMMIAERIGFADSRRKMISEAQFAPLIALFEPYRENIEYLLEEYSEEDCGSWRDYAQHVCERAPDEVWKQGRALLDVGR